MQLRRPQATHPFPAILNKEGINEYCLYGGEEYFDAVHACTGYPMSPREGEAEKIACPLCSEQAAKRRHQENGYVMVRCLRCGFIYQNPRPSQQELLKAYQTYLPEGEEEIEAWGRMMVSVFKGGADLIERTMPRGRLLDVGTGYGFFLGLMQSRGWEVMGLEVSPIGAQYGRKRWGLSILSQPWEEASFDEDEFDVVTAFYVVEHLPDPLAFFREVHRILRPGGMILVRYPHTTPIKDILALMRIKNGLYHLPYHLSDFSPRTMRRALEQTGFTKIATAIGGFTAPSNMAGKWAGRIFGNLAESLCQLSCGKILLPGVSKTTIARKVEQ
jgi:2-polyprenyl-3-methyl-5-hydroxy-6-metoxy-1,4-benzoquinol methylase